MISDIIKKGSVLGAPVISIRIRHMLALMRIRPPKKLAAPSSAYMPTSPGALPSIAPAAMSSSAQMRPKQPPKTIETVKRPLGMKAPYVSAASR